MVTVNTKKINNGYLMDVRCLSTDEKPTVTPTPNGYLQPGYFVEIQNGTPLIEIDTGKKYLFDGASKTWKEIESSVVITPASGVEF